MLMKSILICFLYFLSIVFSFGGWEVTPISDPGVQDAALFAVQQAYQSNYISHKVVYAEKQVVAGLNYKLTIDTTVLPDRACKSEFFIVWNKFGTKSVTSRNENPAGCSK